MRGNFLVLCEGGRACKEGTQRRMVEPTGSSKLALVGTEVKGADRHPWAVGQAISRIEPHPILQGVVKDTLVAKLAVAQLYEKVAELGPRPQGEILGRQAGVGCPRTLVIEVGVDFVANTDWRGG